MSFLEDLILRNRSQHRRTEYFQKLCAVWRGCKALRQLRTREALQDLADNMGTSTQVKHSAGAHSACLMRNKHRSPARSVFRYMVIRQEQDMV
jgi:hypothetical protein